MKQLPPLTQGRKTRKHQADLNDTVRDLQGVLTRTMNGSPIEMRYLLSNQDLPVMVDALQIKEAILNLVVNARDAMPRGGLLTVRTGFARLHGRFLGADSHYDTRACAFVAVSDTGRGMDEETIRKAFEPFFTTKGGIARGLGLPVAYHIVKRHEGSMNVESWPGYGTTVKVYLPLVESSPALRHPIPLPPAAAYASLNDAGRATTP